MEAEARNTLIEALKTAYSGELKKPTANMGQSVDELLTGLSEDDRFSLSGTLQAEYYRARQAGDSYSYLGLAWRLHPWTTGS